MHIKVDTHKKYISIFLAPLMIKMCVVRRLLVTAILLESIIWPFCTAYSSTVGFKCDCPTKDGDTMRQDAGNVWTKCYFPINPHSTVNYHGQIPFYYQLFNGQRVVPPPSNAMNYQRQTPSYNYYRQTSADANNRFSPTNMFFHRPSSSIGKGESYHFIYEAENYRKEESADEDGNIRGYFEYEDDGGLHTLNYTCNDKTGFRITGGNLAPAFPDFLPSFRRNIGKPVSVTPKSPTTRRPIKEPAYGKLDFPVSEDAESAVAFSLSTLKLNLENLTKQLNELFKTFYDARNSERKSRPYYISVNSGLFEMEESSYSNGDARGYIQFEDIDGHHNLSYFRNEVIGFLVTGGDLAVRSPTYLPPSDAVRSNRGVFRNYTSSSPGRINVTVIRDGDDVTFVKGKTTAEPGA